MYTFGLTTLRQSQRVFWKGGKALSVLVLDLSYFILFFIYNPLNDFSKK